MKERKIMNIVREKCYLSQFYKSYDFFESEKSVPTTQLKNCVSLI